MPKNIVVCCDGTANEFAQDRTNVIKLYYALMHDTPAQIVYYHPGIGTMEPFGALSPLTRKLTKLLGMAVGYQLANDVRDAYVFLMQHYEVGDCIYLFGFSRGAFTVRTVAALIHMYGIIRKGNETLVPYAIRMQAGIQRGRDDRTAIAAYFDLASEFKRTMSCASPRIKFVGVWDTVSSVGWLENPLHLPYEANNPDIEIGRHAVSIDERRAFFRTHLWRVPETRSAQDGPRDMQQVWFPGVHCDIGGGYPEAEQSLEICLGMDAGRGPSRGVDGGPGERGGSARPPGRVLRACRSQWLHSPIPARRLASSRVHPQAPLELEQGKVGTPHEFPPSPVHTARLLDSRLSISSRWRLRKADSTQRYTRGDQKTSSDTRGFMSGLVRGYEAKPFRSSTQRAPFSAPWHKLCPVGIQGRNKSKPAACTDGDDGGFGSPATDGETTETPICVSILLCPPAHPHKSKALHRSETSSSS
jgi:hypothetical protein